MPEFEGKNHYLIGVKAKGSAKEKVTWCYLTQDIEIQNKIKINKIEKNKKIEKQKNNKNMDKRELTKAKRKEKYNELKRTLKEVWTKEMESDNDKEEIQSLKSHINRYII